MVDLGAFSGSWEIGMRLWDQGRGKRCTWGILRWRVGILKGNVWDLGVCFSAVMPRIKLYVLVCSRAVHLVLPWPSRSLLCSCWVWIIYHIAFVFLFLFLSFALSEFVIQSNWGQTRLRDAIQISSRKLNAVYVVGNGNSWPWFGLNESFSLFLLRHHNYASQSSVTLYLLNPAGKSPMLIPGLIAHVGLDFSLYM